MQLGQVDRPSLLSSENFGTFTDRVKNGGRRKMGAPVTRGGPSQARIRDLTLRQFLWTVVAFAIIACLICRAALQRHHPSVHGSQAAQGDLVLVSYSYYEKDAIQKANAEFFLKLGMGVNSTFSRNPHSDYIFVVNGNICSPCEELYPSLKPDRLLGQFGSTLSNAWSSKDIAMLWRTENEGMDFAAHNITLEWVKQSGRISKYRFFMFLNSSVRGPFFPSYLPQGWHWHQAFTQRLQGSVVGVSSSIVCLPDIDAGGPGPRMESWAFALDRKGDDGIVVRGEYGLSTILLSAGHNIATLMSRYSPGINWQDSKHWGCNDQAHPSRHGTYDGISMHPFETVFVKASWHVGQPHLDRYSNWLWKQAQGIAGTDGIFDERMYRYAISMEAQEPNYAEEGFKVLDNAFA